MKSSAAIGIIWFVMILGAVLWQLSRSPSPWISLLVVALVVAWGVQWFISSRKEKRESEELADWHRRLEAAVDVHDFEDDGHLHELFQPAERERLIQELERMPRGSRSLRRAVEIVNPELVDADA